MGLLSRMSSILPVVVSLIFALETIVVLTADPTPAPDACAARIDNMTIDTTNASLVAACSKCVGSNDNKTVCGFMLVLTPKDSYICASPDRIGQFTNNACMTVDACNNKFGPSEPPGPNTTTTTTTTTQKPTTSPPAPTPPPPPTPVPPNGTTTVAPNSTTTLAPGTTTTVSPVPQPTTATPTPAPSSGGSFSFANFLGGIVFALAVSSLAYVGFRFYRARNPNYHTF